MAQAALKFILAQDGDRLRAADRHERRGARGVGGRVRASPTSRPTTSTGIAELYERNFDVEPVAQRLASRGG